MSTLPARFWAKVNKTDTCWLWTASLSHGYGQFKIDGRRTMRRAHRLAYADLVEPIPDGGQIDHTCFNKACVNPSHLRVVTNKQNQEHRRGAKINSKTGARGVTRRASGRYRAKLCHEYRTIDCGTYATVEEAATAWQAKADELFTHHQLTAAVAA